jgi:sulfite reductase alpha subunit-like flavoprotein
MPDSVRGAVKKVAMVFGGLEESAAEKFLQQLDKSGRYQAETWS